MRQVYEQNIMKDSRIQANMDDNKEKYLYFYIGVVIGLVIGVSCGVIYMHEKYQDTLDDFFNLTYPDEIQPKGEREISSIVKEVSSIQNEKLKLLKLAEWTTDNFTGVYFSESSTKLWPNEYSASPPYNHKYIGDSLSGYGYDRDGNIRARSSTKFWKDPYWIAYMKTGACEEVAVLFYELTNRSGFESRLVASPGDDLGHIWVEVKIDNEWLYADCACYHDRGGFRWLDRQENYTKNCYSLTKVFQYSGEKTDLSDFYVPKQKTGEIRGNLINKINDIHQYWNIFLIPES